MHEVLVNRLGGLSLPRKSVVRLTDRPDMTLDVYRGRKTTMQQQQYNIMKFIILLLYCISAIATVTAYPNGHLKTLYNTPPNCPPSPSEDSGVVPMRPVYPRTQYQMQYGAQGPPRVNAGDISQTSSKSV